MKTSDVKTSDVKTSDVKTSDVKTSDVKTSDVKTSDVKTRRVAELPDVERKDKTGSGIIIDLSFATCPALLLIISHLSFADGASNDDLLEVTDRNNLRQAGASTRHLEGYYSYSDQSTKDDNPAIPALAIYLALMALFTMFLFLFLLLLIFNLKDSAMIRRYTTTGHVVEAVVTSCTCAKRYVGQREEEVDYICIVEYDVIAQSDDGDGGETSSVCDAMLRFRKQIKAKGRELYDVESTPIPTRIKVKQALFVRSESAASFTHYAESDTQQISPRSLIVRPKSPATIMSPLSVIKRSDTMNTDYRPPIEVIQQIHLLILPEEPQSGYSKEQLELHNSWKFRLPMIVLVTFFLATSVFCLVCAVKQISQLERSSTVYFAIPLLICLVLVAESIRRVEPITKMLVEDEYFKLLDHMMMVTNQDSSSFTTMSFSPRRAPF
jgi:hypothetical protein